VALSDVDAHEDAFTFETMHGNRESGIGNRDLGNRQSGITTVRLSCRRCPLTHFERTPYQRRRPASISIRPVALSHLTVWGWFNACGSNGLRAVDGLPAAAHLRRLRRPLSGRLQGPGVFLSRSIPH